jgi:hypothetical protein
VHFPAPLHEPWECPKLLDNVSWVEAMTVPLQLSYNPSPKRIALLLGGGIAWLCLQIAWGQRTVHSFAFWLGIAAVIMGLLVAVRRVFFRRVIILDNDGLSLPSGLGRLHSVAIPYTSIRQIQHIPFLSLCVLQVVTDTGKFEIVSEMLPDRTSYVQVARILNAVVQTNKNSTQPNPGVPFP